jgi:hypothetical protein
MREKISIPWSKNAGLNHLFSEGKIDKGCDDTPGLSPLHKEWVLGSGHDDFSDRPHFNFFIILSKYPLMDLIEVNFGSGAISKASPFFQIAIIEFHDPSFPRTEIRA